MRTRAHDRYGALILDQLSDNTGNSTDFVGPFAATAGLRNFITAVWISNRSATYVSIDFRDGAAGAVMFTLHAPPSSHLPYLLPGHVRQPTANTPLAIDASAAVTAIHVTVAGYKDT